MNSELPIQVDGEPWIQCAGEIVVLKSALKVSNSDLNDLTLRIPRSDLRKKKNTEKQNAHDVP